MMRLRCRYLGGGVCAGSEQQVGVKGSELECRDARLMRSNERRLDKSKRSQSI